MYKPAPDADAVSNADALQSQHGKQLAFAIQPRQQRNWGWAAVCASVARYYNPATTISQCQLANWAFGQINCCVEGAGTACNQPFNLRQALKHVGHLNVETVAGVPISRLRGEIDAGQPVIAIIRWPGSGIAHPLVITGYDTSSGAPSISIADPVYGPSTILFANFPTSYRGGAEWVSSALTQA